MTEILRAVNEHDYEEFKRLLIENPPIIDETDDEGRCMALLAALSGDFRILKYTVEYSRASMNIYDREHRNILHYGVLSGNPDIVRYLVERVGMDPLKADINLITPYDLAVKNNYSEIEKYFEQVCRASIDDMYRNPIRTGMFPDPSVVRVEDDYYMVNSSFVFFPCIPVSHSKDLINWEIIGYAITNPEWAGLNGLEGGRGYWAPDISYHDGRFFITATYRLNDTGTIYRKQIIVSSQRPEGPYSKPAVIDEDGIDPSIFVDDDGRKYMLLNRGARILELNRECTKQISEAELLYYGDNKRAPEGPHLLKKDGYYYLFEAEGGTGPGHRITVSRSKTLKGIYEPCPFNPIMRQNDEAAAIQRCGHGKPVMTPDGRWYMVYLCGRMLDGRYSILGRETALDEITWTADGWPMVNKLRGPSVLNKKPYPGEYKKYTGDFEKFEGKGPGLEWMYTRAPIDGMTGINGKALYIRGSSYDLSSTECRSFIVKRQKHFHFKCETLTYADRLSEGQEYGITCYYDENTYLKYGVTYNCGRIFLKITEHIDEQDRASVLKDISDECGNSIQHKIKLMIVTDGLRRSFYYSTDENICDKIDDDMKPAGSLDNVYYLCDEGLKKGKRFTGAMVGLYAYSGDGPEMTAYFDYFNYVMED